MSESEIQARNLNWRADATPGAQAKAVADYIEAALKQAIGILQSLRLYYLPSAAEAEAITGGKRLLALPGRRSRAGETTDAV